MAVTEWDLDPEVVKSSAEETPVSASTCAPDDGGGSYICTEADDDGVPGWDDAWIDLGGEA